MREIVARTELEHSSWVLALPVRVYHDAEGSVCAGQSILQVVMGEQTALVSVIIDWPEEGTEGQHEAGLPGAGVGQAHGHAAGHGRGGLETQEL